jgi:hypothetical protein
LLPPAYPGGHGNLYHFCISTKIAPALRKKVLKSDSALKRSLAWENFRRTIKVIVATEYNAFET